MRERDGQVKGVGVTVARSDGAGERTFKGSGLHRSLSAAQISQRLDRRSQALRKSGPGAGAGGGVVRTGPPDAAAGWCASLSGTTDPLSVIGQTLSRRGAWAGDRLDGGWVSGGGLGADELADLGAGRGQAKRGGC